MITHVALLCKGRIYALPKPARHPDVMRMAVKDGIVKYVGQREQGFLDSTGRFLSRREAKAVAVKCGQVPSGGKPELYSEDLW